MGWDGMGDSGAQEQEGGTPAGRRCCCLAFGVSAPSLSLSLPLPPSLAVVAAVALVILRTSPSRRPTSLSLSPSFVARRVPPPLLRSR